LKNVLPIHQTMTKTMTFFHKWQKKEIDKQLIEVVTNKGTNESNYY